MQWELRDHSLLGSILIVETFLGRLKHQILARPIWKLYIETTHCNILDFKRSKNSVCHERYVPFSGILSNKLTKVLWGTLKVTNQWLPRCYPFVSLRVTFYYAVTRSLFAIRSSGPENGPGQLFTNRSESARRLPTCRLCWAAHGCLRHVIPVYRRNQWSARTS